MNLQNFTFIMSLPIESHSTIISDVSMPTSLETITDNICSAKLKNSLKRGNAKLFSENYIDVDLHGKVSRRKGYEVMQREVTRPDLEGRRKRKGLYGTSEVNIVQ